MVNYIKTVVAEAKKLQIPSRREVYLTTIVILVVIAISSILVMLSDLVISKIVSLIFGL